MHQYYSKERKRGKLLGYTSKTSRADMILRVNNYYSPAFYKYSVELQVI